MQKVKKIIIISIFSLMFIILTSLCNEANASSGDLYLNNLDFDVKVNSDGSMDVTETWNIDIEDTNTLFKTFKTDKNKYTGISDVKVIEVLRDGSEKRFEQINELMYHVTKDCYYGMKNKDGDFEIAWGVGLDSRSDTRTYKISYTVKDAIKNCDNFSELYWQFVGKDFEISANKIKGKINLPSEAERKEDIKVWGHTEGLNGEIYATSKKTVEFEINKFRQGRFVEIRIAIPNDIYIYSGRKDDGLTLEKIIKEETKWANAANARRARSKIGAGLLYSIAIIGLIALCVYIIYRIIKNKQFLNELPEKFKSEQQITYFRDIPDENATPAESLRMLKMKTMDLMSTEVGNVFAATLLDLNLKGLLEFENENDQNGKQTIKIKIKNDNTAIIANNMDELEIFTFIKEAINKKGGVITSKELEKYIKSNQSKVVKLKTKIDKLSKLILCAKGYIDEKVFTLKEKHAGYTAGYITLMAFTLFGMIILPAVIMEDHEGDIVIGIFNIIFLWFAIITEILALIATIIKIKITNKMNVFTQNGVNKFSEWNGLKKFMEEFSMLDKREVPEIVIWEKYLVYATAFGIADKVIKQLKIVYPNIDQNANYHTGTYMGLMMHTNFSSSFSNSISSAMSSSYSSGSGGGGGFSGGGGRRPEEAGGGGGR